jgi:hypothetical protein
MEERMIFIVVNWKNAHDWHFSTEVALELNYTFRNFPDESKALFEPKTKS